MFLKDLDTRKDEEKPKIDAFLGTRKSFPLSLLISTLQKEEWGAWKKIEQGSEWAAQMLVKIYNKCHNLVIIFLILM